MRLWREGGKGLKGEKAYIEREKKGGKERERMKAGKSRENEWYDFNL